MTVLEVIRPFVHQPYLPIQSWDHSVIPEQFKAPDTDTAAYPGRSVNSAASSRRKLTDGIGTGWDGGNSSHVRPSRTRPVV